MAATNKGRRKRKEDEEMTRIAVVAEKSCKPKKCRLECAKSCPVNRQGKICIDVKKTSKIAYISELLCIGCNICVKKCPFEAIQIINLPKNLESSTTHRFGPNSFKLHRLPIPRQNQVLGLVGSNGIGKSTALKILSGKLKPNLGDFETPPGWEEIRKYFRGSELQNYFKRILEDDLIPMLKPQYVDHIPKQIEKLNQAKNKSKDPNAIGISVKKLLAKKLQRYETLDEICNKLDLIHVLDREPKQLSGGELQRFAIAACAIRDCDVYMFDEPSSYLDVKQRLNAAKVIRELISPEEQTRRLKKHNNNPNKSAYVICVEHDLAVLDYLSDYVCLLYGTCGAFGVVSMPFGVREGINVFLAGFLPTENMRFREFELNFKVSDSTQADEANKDNDNNNNNNNDDASKKGGGGGKKGTKKDNDDKDKEEKANDSFYKIGAGYHYPYMTKTLINKETNKEAFFLEIESGNFRDSEIIVMLGPNGSGKTTFVKILAGLLKPDSEDAVPELRVSYKPQKISPSFTGSVQQLFHNKIRGTYVHPQFNTDVIKPLKVSELYDKIVINLSGGELQRVALVLALGSPASVYLIDEPSAYLDSEQRIIAAKVIKRFILHSKKSAFVVEHDFIMATYLADRVIVFDGIPAKKCIARKPQSLLEGMNHFLANLNVTFRRDPNNYRPRINKLNSVKDTEQKKSGNYFFLDATD